MRHKHVLFHEIIVCFLAFCAVREISLVAFKNSLVTENSFNFSLSRLQNNIALMNV